ncbi:MAG: hypothetical protein EBZ48_02570 [Proteobacteria bacterium]|nr:hypothetical protein [Pseudomonadota bacterium]
MAANDGFLTVFRREQAELLNYPAEGYSAAQKSVAQSRLLRRITALALPSGIRFGLKSRLLLFKMFILYRQIFSGIVRRMETFLRKCGGRRSLRALSAALLAVLCMVVLGCKSSQQQEVSSVGPVGAAVYLRGTFNNWDLSMPMEYSEKYGYLATLNLPAGSHTFKLADATWTMADFGTALPHFAFGEPFPVIWRGANIPLHLEKPTSVIFALEVTSPREGSLRVIIDGPEAVAEGPGASDDAATVGADPQVSVQ